MDMTDIRDNQIVDHTEMVDDKPSKQLPKMPLRAALPTRSDPPFPSLACTLAVSSSSVSSTPRTPSGVHMSAALTLECLMDQADVVPVVVPGDVALILSPTPVLVVTVGLRRPPEFPPTLRPSI